MGKVTAVKPVFYNRWRHPGEEFECDDKAAEKFKREGKIKKDVKTSVTKQKE